MESREKERYVTIKLHSSIRHPGQDEEKHELNAKGLLIEKAGKSYLKYEEQQSGKSIQTIVKLDSDRRTYYASRCSYDAVAVCCSW